MNTQRFNEVFAKALSASRSLKKRGFIRRNELPRITPHEHKWLCEQHPKMARFTRCFEYDDSEYVEDTGNYQVPGTEKRRNAELFVFTRNMTQARTPVIREVWVGARSMGCVGEDDLPEGFQSSQIEQEDQAELTDLTTLTYDDPIGFDRWLDAEVSRRILAARGKRWVNNVIIRRIFTKVITHDLPKTHDGSLAKCMINDDETGEYRPLRVGDVITVAHGSNEDLDALYMEEPADDRSEQDSMIRELLRDRVNPNSDFEQDMLNDPQMVMPSQADELFDNDLYLRRVADYMAEQLVERKPSLKPLFLELREEAFKRIKRAHGALRSDNEGKVISGRFITPKDHWDDVEQRIRTLERHVAHQRHKVRPAPVNWDAIRTTA